MTTQTIETRIKLLNSTLAVIEAVNPVLLPGEKWLERHATTGAITGRSKTGLDGVVQPNDSITGTPFNNLPFDPFPTAAQVGADAAGTAAAAIAAHVAAADAHPGYTTPQEAAAAAPVQAVSLTPPSGWGTSSANTGGSVNLAFTLPTGYSLPNDSSQGQWDTAYSERLRWDGGAAGLVPATGRASLDAAATPVQWAVGNVVCPINAVVGPSNFNQANIIYLMPFKPPVSFRTSEIGARISNAVAGGNFALAIYASQSNGSPTGLPLVNTGSLSGAVATILSDTAVVDLYDNQQYWMAGIMSANSMTFQGIASSSTYSSYVFGASTFAAVPVGVQRQISCNFGTWLNLTGATTTEISGALRAPVIYTKIGALL